MSHLGCTPRTTAARTSELKASMVTDKRCPDAVFDRGADRVAGAPFGRNRSRRRASRFARAVGMATTTATSALAMAMIVPQVDAGGSVVWAPVKLLSGSLQSAINEVLDAQQQVISINSAMPWLTPYDIDHQLVPYTKMMADMMLNFGLFSANASRGIDSNGALLSPAWSAPAANPLSLMNFGSPDNTYLNPATGDGTWTATIYPGPGTQSTILSPMAGNGITSPFVTAQSVDLSHFTPNDNGSYTITLSPTEQPGNWLDTAGSVSTVNRLTAGDWGLMQSTMTYHEEGTPAYTMPVLSNDDITLLLHTIGTNMVSQNTTSNYLGLAQAFSNVPFNHSSPIIPSTPGTIGPAVVGQFGSLGRFQLDPDQALIVKVPDLESDYSSFQVGSALQNVGLQPGWATMGAQLNGTQAFHASDGFTYYVISDKDPGVANWFNTDGLTNGDDAPRWQGMAPGQTPFPSITNQVVPVADVKNYLPADTPTVTPAERAVDVTNHMLQYDYKVDQAHDSGWVTLNLEIQQIKAAIGTDEFNTLFGVQSDVPSVFDRMTDPSLMADPTTVIHDLLTTNPRDILSAIVQNIPMLRQDVVMPMVLAVLSCDQLIKDTGLQGLGGWLNATFTDPTTSITAGFLNARDDLHVVMMNADGYSALTSNDFSIVSEKLSDLHNSVSNMLSAGVAYALGLGDSSAVFDPSQMATDTATAAATDAISNAVAGPPLDLMP